MRACTIATPDVSRAFAGWRRALDADARTFEELYGLVLSSAQELDYDLVLVALSDESLSWLEPLGRLLATRSQVVLAVWVERPLPETPHELEGYRCSLKAADLVLTSEVWLRRELEERLAVRAVELTPPWFETPPQAFATGRPPAAGKPRLAVVSGEVRTHGWLLRELGATTYAWTRLRYRVDFCHPSDGAARITASELVYLAEPPRDGGELAARCAESGALLLAPRSYEAARFCFPFTTYEPASGSALLLWLLSAPELVETFREHAAHRARQLADGDRRLQLARAVQQEFPSFRCAPDPQRPSLLDEIRHVAGPLPFSYGEDECAVVCLVRNGGEHLPSFLEHYRALGVRHFVFIDNASDDGSRALLERQPDATVYETTLPHKYYENELRRLIIERHCQRRWCLNVDIDELFDYPGSDTVPLGALLGYLRRQGATAMVAYLLDMFARENVFGDARTVDLKAEYPCYDLSDVEKVGYFAPEIAAFCDENRLSDPRVGCYFGGVRRRVFGGRQRAQFLLTKHPLIFLDGELQPVVHPHYSNRARLADVTGALLHYKFTPSFKAKVSESVASSRYTEFAQRQYDDYHQTLARRSRLVIDGPGRRTLRDVRQLVDEGFLHASAAFRELALAAADRSGPRAAIDSSKTGANHG